MGKFLFDKVVPIEMLKARAENGVASLRLRIPGDRVKRRSKLRLKMGSEFVN